MDPNIVTPRVPNCKSLRSRRTKTQQILAFAWHGGQYIDKPTARRVLQNNIHRTNNGNLEMVVSKSNALPPGAFTTCPMTPSTRESAIPRAPSKSGHGRLRNRSPHRCATINPSSRQLPARRRTRSACCGNSGTSCTSCASDRRPTSAHMQRRPASRLTCETPDAKARPSTLNTIPPHSAAYRCRHAQPLHHRLNNEFETWRWGDCHAMTADNIRSKSHLNRR